MLSTFISGAPGAATGAAARAARRWHARWVVANRNRGGSLPPGAAGCGARGAWWRGQWCCRAGVSVTRGDVREQHQGRRAFQGSSLGIVREPVDERPRYSRCLRGPRPGAWLRPFPLPPLWSALVYSKRNLSK